MKLVNFIAGNETGWGAAHGDLLSDLNLARAYYLASRELEAKHLARDLK